MLRLQAVPAALALVRDAEGFTPAEASDFLLELLEHDDDSTNPYAGGGLQTAVFRACGQLRLPSDEASLCPHSLLSRWRGFQC